MAHMVRIADDVYSLPLGNLLTNCYIVDAGKHMAVLIDPGDESALLVRALNTLKLRPVVILNTHIHFDHVGADSRLKDMFDSPICLHQADEPLIADVQHWTHALCDEFVPFSVDRYLEDGEELVFGDARIKVIHTPGHSPGSVSFQYKDMLFCGDVIFANGGYGRTDMWGGSYKVIMDTIRNKILTLPDNTVLCPGHGPVTTVEKEKQYFC